MSGMPLVQALLLLASLIALIALTQVRLLHAFLAIVMVAAAFGLAAGFSTAFVGKAFGAGFVQAIYSPGLVIVAAGFVAGLAEATGAAGWLAAQIASWRWAGATRLPALCGLVVGLAASPSTAFALLTPLLRAVTGGAEPKKRGAAPAALALAISASHGLALISPVPIAAASILDAPWSRVALFGVPLAVLWPASARLGRAGLPCRRSAASAGAGRANEANGQRLVRCGACGRDRRSARAPDRPIARRHSERTARRRHRARDGDRPRPSAGAARGRHGHHGDRQWAARPQAPRR